MPEGDTVHRVARRLDAALSGQVLVASDFRVPAHATLDLAGEPVHATVARGKHLLTRIGELTLHTHLRMDGSWRIGTVGQRWRAPAHTARVVLRTAAVEAVGFQLLVEVLPTDREPDVVGHLGPDLLGPDWDPDEAIRRLAASPDVAIADALLEQRNLAGIGNVYKAELCFLHGLHPLTPVGAVPDLPRVVDRARRLLEANKDRADRTTTGERRPGRRLWVYGRRGPCLRCGTRIQMASQGPQTQERVTWWCPSCQPADRLP